MFKSLHNTFKILLFATALSIPVALRAEDFKEIQVEMEQQVAISVNGTTLRVKNADGQVLEIFSLTGEKVLTQRIEGASHPIELGQLQRGYYIVKIGKFTRKFYLR